MQLHEKLIIAVEDIIKTAQIAGIPKGVIKDITREQLVEWLTESNLARRVRAEVAGYVLTRSIDGGAVKGREVSLVHIRKDGLYEPHYHANSDAMFIVVNGSAVLLGSQDEKVIKPGDLIAVPRRTWHGFRLQPTKSLTWVSVQYPPIHSSDGEEDLHFPDHLRNLV